MLADSAMEKQGSGHAGLTKQITKWHLNADFQCDFIILRPLTRTKVWNFSPSLFIAPSLTVFFTPFN
jgi:hypothetical protein